VKNSYLLILKFILYMLRSSLLRKGLVKCFML